MKAERPLRTLVWYWGANGAGIRFAARVAECIAQRHGAANVGLALHEQNAWIERSRAAGHPIMSVGGANGRNAVLSLALQAPRRWRALERQVSAFRPDVVVIPMGFALAWPLSLVMRRRGIPIVYVVHDDQPHAGDYFVTYQAALQGLLLRDAAHVVALSDFVRRRLTERGRRHPFPCTLIPLSAHDVSLGRPARPVRSGEVALLFLGRLLPYKGLALLAEALGAFRDTPGWRLTIAGEGPEAARLRTLFGHLPQVDLGWVRKLSEAEVDALLDAHDVLVCPYTEASQSGVVSEGLYHGLPSLVTPVGALAEQVGFGAAGWVARSASAEGLREGLSRILANPAAIRRASEAASAMVTPPRGNSWGDLVESVGRPWLKTCFVHSVQRG